MKGEYSTTNEERVECSQWIEGLRVKKGVGEELSLDTTFEDFKGYVKKVQENKKSSPSGRHYGHYKVLALEEDLLKVVFGVLYLALKWE